MPATATGIHHTSYASELRERRSRTVLVGGSDDHVLVVGRDRDEVFVDELNDLRRVIDWLTTDPDHAIGPRKLIVAPGGTHRSVQHDPELQASALRWIERALTPDS